MGRNKQSCLTLGNMDHYTLIVEDAKKVADFHVNYLGFKYKYEKLINTGTVVAPDYDMTNCILLLPHNKKIFCVVTQGMNEDTVFHKYLKKYGPGIHHIAFKVNDIQSEWDFCVNHKIETTSSEIILDPISGLKQFFITKNYAGYFIELIERTPNSATEEEDFTEQNMKRLADSIKKAI
ncbi:hypothetical protein DGG96_09180 [Legionella qingyii]|uniref:VOC domain-containing protein n=1 Tax=Legionella qingyii TaxID=2184757 RepID=A0A317U3G3_9GAMM|nr:VOC family protein [Legionella qingyii]PWY55899.1 hypothetical protein DGG96_09180 [Legionella qingyii]RUR22476.1 hypothetical protein ELY20_09295 [Legionella qingyii]RUR27947.1 hypothetical protein ELY16_04030 [Legionella qingyii]